MLDDFGQGYSSLASLRTLRLSKIKIDRAFIAGIGRIEQDEVGLIFTIRPAGGRWSTLSFSGRDILSSGAHSARSRTLVSKYAG